MNLMPVVSAVLTSVLSAYAPVMPADIAAQSPERWILKPLDHLQDGFIGVELFFDRLPTPSPVLELGSNRLSPQIDSASSHVVALSSVPFAAESLVVVCAERPISAALFAATPMVELGRESAPSDGAPIWRFRRDLIPEPWRLDPALRLITDAPHEWLQLESPGHGSIHTSNTRLGLEAPRHPVAVLQFGVLTTKGEASLIWSSRGDPASTLRFRLSTRGLWNQTALPLYREKTWSGLIDSLSLVPVDHPAAIRVDWIRFPRLARFWALMLSGVWQRVALMGASLIIITCGIWLAWRLPVGPSVLAATALLPVLTPIALPFPELSPSFNVSIYTVPWYSVAILILASALCIGHRPGILELSTWSCVLITVIHGLKVAEGSGLPTAVALLSGPAALVLGINLARRGLGAAVKMTVAAFVLLAAVHAVVLPNPSDDPLYGSLLTTIGRAYWDTTVAGRTAGMFVHPLAFAVVTLAVGLAMLAQPSARSRSLRFMGLLVLVLGLRSVSRVYVGVLAALVALLWNRGCYRRLRIVLLAAPLLLAVGLFACGEQGFLRGFQLRRRVEGVKVAVMTLRHRPLQGVGWGRYRTAVQRYGSLAARTVPYTTPDNSYVRLVAEGGVLGGGIWIIWFAHVAVYAVHRGRLGRNATAAPVVAVLIMYAVFDAAYWSGVSIPCLTLLGVGLGEEPARTA